ncbi:hypothetical protein [Candidatus Sodalis sp. SoCistrobi]|uniref:hypothetical protein n=1 Tax=Candidatus Sodalis sp. SoCistrobi TaxID=1922216 RepID=UPI00093F9C69|nr:hypothetical protein [Candidatus Sodalis sp. SoCistrobi]
MFRKYSTDFAIASLDAQGVVRRSGWIVVYCTHPVTREYLCATQEYLFVGALLPPHSYADKPALPAQRQARALVRSCDGRCWQTVDDLRGNVAYRKDTGRRLVIDFLGGLPTELTLLAPSSPNDTWDGQKWAQPNNHHCHSGADPEIPG